MFEEIFSLYTKRKPVLGVAYNDVHYRTTYEKEGKKYTCPYYTIWRGVVDRCFNKGFHKKKPTYANCTMHTPWLYLSNFKAWMETQDHKGKAIDKDIIIPGNKHYSPDTCIFVTGAVNNLFTLRENYRGKYPLGVSSMTCNGTFYYVASCSFYGKQTRLGYFKSVVEAKTTYDNAKRDYIKEIAENETDHRLKKALLNRASLI